MIGDRRYAYDVPTTPHLCDCLILAWRPCVNRRESLAAKNLRLGFAVLDGP